VGVFGVVFGFWRGFCWLFYVCFLGILVTESLLVSFSMVEHAEICL
jgi:hypothetical protein